MRAFFHKFLILMELFNYMENENMRDENLCKKNISAKKYMSQLYNDTSWEEFYKERGQFQSSVKDIVKDSVEFLRKNKCKKILDLGCGTGRHSFFLAKEGFEVTGIDPSVSGLEIARKKAEKLGLKIEFKVGTKEDTGFEDDYFDGIVCTNVLSHSNFSGIKDSVREIERVLKRGGLFIITDITTKREDYGIGKEIEQNTFINIPKHIDSEMPHHFFTEEELKGLFKNFEVLKKYYTKEGRHKGQINLILRKK